MLVPYRCRLSLFVGQRCLAIPPNVQIQDCLHLFFLCVAKQRKMEQALNYIENYNLPNGGKYSGQCSQNGPFIELKGQGQAYYPDGSSYKGSFDYGRPLGLGKYVFPNGHFHWGYFDNLPNGIGYLNEQTGFTIGSFDDGRLYGWAIKFYNNRFQFGWWENNKLIQDESKNVLWCRAIITQRLRLAKEAHLIQVSTEDLGFIRFGFPNSKHLNRISGRENILPSVGFNFLKDGRVIVGEFDDTEMTGQMLVYNKTKTFQFGWWENSNLVKENNLQDYQNPSDYYEEGLMVFY